MFRALVLLLGWSVVSERQERCEDLDPAFYLQAENDFASIDDNDESALLQFERARGRRRVQPRRVV